MSKMLVQHLPHLAGHRIVLASASPRRHDLLRLLGLTFEVRPHPDKSVTFLWHVRSVHVQARQSSGELGTGNNCAIMRL